MTSATEIPNANTVSDETQSDIGASSDLDTRRQIDLDLAEPGWGGVTFYLCASIGVGVVGRTYQSHPNLMLTVTALLAAFGGLRLALILSVRRTTPSRAPLWRALLVVAMLGSGLTWSMLTARLAWDSTISPGFLGAAFCLLTMGGVEAAAAAPWVQLSRAYLLCLFAPVSTVLFMKGDEHASVLGLALALTVPFVAILVKQLHTGNSKGLEATRELLERQEELVKARMRAEESERIQERFFATISHEMRNPLNGILGMTDCLLDTELSDEQRLQATIISRGGDQLLAVINDVLDLSKAKHGGIQLESVVVSISDVIGEAVAMIGHQATQKGLVINYDPWAMQATGLGDPLRLRQICLNLISNAIKFTEEGSVSVVLQESPSSTLEREVLRITVADTGIGMTEEAKAEIFMPFQQAEAETTRRFGGTGLGLSIVAQLVELMEGEVAVESELGKGTSLHVDIPFEICEEPTVVNLSQIENSVSGAVSQIDLRVLVAEDNAVNQLVITRMLARLGCKVSMASNGREAVELATNGEFDLILMDLQMPEMDGCEASRRIRQAEQAGKTRIPILALTGSEMGMQACFEAGMDGYLTKPIRSEGLIEALQLHG